jgi:hypothetical protein
MQSYLQFRRLGHAVHRQLDNAPERGTASSVKNASTDEAATPGSGRVSQDLNEPAVNPLSQKPTQYSDKIALGKSLAGIDIQKQIDTSAPDSYLFIVDWEDENDPLNPRNFSYARRMTATLLVTALAFIVGSASAIESGVLPQITETYHVSEVVGSLVTGNMISIWLSTILASLIFE